MRATGNVESYSLEMSLSPGRLEEMYSVLHESLVQLCEVLLHSQMNQEIDQAFRIAGSAAIRLFDAEEKEMEATNCPVLELNRAGHAKFRQDLSNLYAQVKGEYSGIRAAGVLRRTLLPWLLEHHALVDRQLEHHLRKLGAASNAFESIAT